MLKRNILISVSNLKKKKLVPTLLLKIISSFIALNRKNDDGSVNRLTRLFA